MSLRRSAAVAAAALAASAACTRMPAGATAIESVQLSEANLAANPELGLPADRAQLASQGAIEASGKFALRPRGARMKLEIEHAHRTSAGHDREQAEVMVSLELSPESEGDRLLAEGLG